MTTRERREEYSTTNVVRTLHPSRPLSPNNTAITSLDNNLDYLLDDLQSSVSRSQNATDYSTTNHRDIQYLSPSNSTTVIRERSVSPGREATKIYKTAHYQYSSSSNTGVPIVTGHDVQQNVNQLDSLLQDLKHERNLTLEKDKSFSSNNVGIDSGLLEPSNTQHVSTTTKTYRSSSGSGDRQRNVNRELQFDSPQSTLTTTTIENRESRSRQRSPNYQKNIETKIVRDVTYDTEPVPDNTLSKRSYTSDYSKTSEHQQQVVPYTTTEIVEVNPTEFSKELNDVPLNTNILPKPGTKVTTTIKTFTYEIPGDATVPSNKSFTYKNEAYNTTNTNNTTIYPERDVPYSPPGQTVVYKHQENYNTINRSDGYPPEPIRGRSPHPDPTTNHHLVYKRDTTENITNVYPGRSLSPQPPPSHTTYLYKSDVTNTNTNVHHPPHGSPVYPNDIHPNRRPIDETDYPTHPGHPGHPGQPGHPGSKHTYIYKHETTNTKNTHYGPPGSGYPGDRPPPSQGYPNNALPPPSSHVYPSNTLPSKPRYPNDPTTVTYKYSTTEHNTSRNVYGHPDHQPLLAPAPFPTEDVPHMDGPDGQTPKRLDDLLATFDDANGHGPNPRMRDEPYVPRKEINTALATSGKQVAIVEPKVPTKNIAGPPVYYPPGHELSVKNEQSGAAWRAQGGYAKASGKYEYEAESKSKSSSKSGAAVVPVCLPLCCAMPCVIM